MIELYKYYTLKKGSKVKVRVQWIKEFKGCYDKEKSKVVTLKTNKTFVIGSKYKYLGGTNYTDRYIQEVINGSVL